MKHFFSILYPRINFFSKQSALALMISFAFCSPDSDKISNEKNKVENPNKNVKIIFFGDSLTAGLGLSHPDDAFPALIGKKLQKDGLKNFEIINAGVSGDTTSGGLARIEWTISRGVDVFILELGNILEVNAETLKVTV